MIKRQISNNNKNKKIFRNIRSFIDLVETNGSQLFDGLKRLEQRFLQAIINMFHQQDAKFYYRIICC